jgi:dTDP-4-amino-4,6-dideoxygalactose transaminase
MSNIEAAIGCAQLKKIKNILLSKKKIYEEYKFYFKSNQKIEMLKPSKFSNYWLNSLMIKKNISYSNLKNIIKKIENKGVQVRPIWYPCHRQKYLKKYENYTLKNSNDLYKKIICLPSSFFLKKKDIKKISNIILNVIKNEI